MTNPFLPIGAISGALAVAAGAFGAHALRAQLEPRLLEVFETAARYQMYHALAIMLVGGWIASCGATASGQVRLVYVSGWAFVAGTCLFSGSLYAMAFSGIRALGAITPLGGVAFIVGWLLLAVAALRRD